MEPSDFLKTFKPNLACKICGDYFMEAMTVIITECMHTFCKNCLIKHLEEQGTCPDCGLIIQHSDPYLQQIGFNYAELDSSKNSKELSPEAVPENQDDAGTKIVAHDASDFGRLDEQVNISLECIDDNLKNLGRPFIRCSSLATINHLKQLIAKKFWYDINKCGEIDILCNEELCSKDQTLEFVYLTRWRFQDPPLRLQFRRRV